MKQNKPVSVIIVNFNRKEYLRRCLDSVSRQSYKNIEIIVIDNSSSDGSVEILKSDYPFVKLIVNNENRLFSSAQNQGIKEANGDYILSLNNDTVLEKCYIEELVETIEKNSEIGMATGRILSRDGKSIDSCGQILSGDRTAKERGFGEINNGQFNEPGYVFGVGAVAALYKKEMLEMLKIDGEYFDSAYGMFLEDLDLNWRANRFGFKAFYNPKAVAYHIRGATAKTEPPNIECLRRYYFPHLSEDLQFHLLKNRYITMIKNDTLKDFISCLGNVLFYEFKLWSYILLFRPRLILKIPRIFGYLKIALEKRKAIKIKLKNLSKNLDNNTRPICWS
ncbi:MAG: glycosyltransferase family 2 protein [Candidatus Omnitrophota bacterium]